MRSGTGTIHVDLGWFTLDRTRVHPYPRRTSTTKESSWRAILPVTSQQRSVGKAMPLAWNPEPTPPPLWTERRAGRDASSSRREGCNYSVHPPELQIRGSSCVPAWSAGMLPSGPLPASRGDFAEPSLSGKHSTLEPVGRASASQAGQAQTGQCLFLVGPGVL